MEKNKLLIEFLDARDQFFGVGNYDRYKDRLQGLARLTVLRNHFEECEWFVSICEKLDTEFNESDLLSYLNNKSDARSLLYVGLLRWPNDYESLNKSAEKGNAMAQGILAK